MVVILIRCLAFWLCLFTIVQAQISADDPSLKGKNIIRFTADHAVFLDPQFHPYVEVYVAIDASSLRFTRNEANLWQAEADIQLQMNGITQNGNNLTLNHQLLTPPLADTIAANKQFLIHHAFRFDVIPDSVKIKVEVKDVNVKKSSVTGVEKDLLIVIAPKDSFLFGEIVFLEQFKKTQKKNAFSRLGYDILPLMTNAYFENKDTLLAYFELYHLEALTKGKYRIRTFISEPELNRPIAQMEQLYPSKSVSDFDINLIKFPISGLMSNSYMIHVQLLDMEKKIIAQARKLFYVSNLNQTAGYMESKENEIMYQRLYALTEKDLDAVIPKLIYISTEPERSFSKSLKDYDMKKNYFINFWRKRMTNPTTPTKEWEDYLRRIRFANDRFRSSFREGWRTDRGRVLLTYGPPADIQSFPIDHDKLPYEIWTYNRIKAQTGVIFVFVDSDLATNEYPLLHSTLTGELYNANWRNNIVKRREKDYNFNSTEQNTYDDFKETNPRTLGSPR